MHLGKLRPGECGVRIDLQQIFAISTERVANVDVPLTEQSPKIVILNAHLSVITARAPFLGADDILGRVSRDVGADSLCRDFLCRTQILFHQDRRHREYVADIVEAVANFVVREIRCGLIVHAKQVANRVVILAAVEPTQSDTAGIDRNSRVRAVKFCQLLVYEFDQHDSLIFSRLLFVFRRHLAVAQHLAYVLPCTTVLKEIRAGTEQLKVQFRFGPLIAMAAKTDILQDREDVWIELRLASRHDGGLGFLRRAKCLAKESYQCQKSDFVQFRKH